METLLDTLKSFDKELWTLKQSGALTQPMYAMLREKTDQFKKLDIEKNRAEYIGSRRLAKLQTRAEQLSHIRTAAGILLTLRTALPIEENLPSFQPAEEALTTCLIVLAKQLAEVMTDEQANS